MARRAIGSEFNYRKMLICIAIIFVIILFIVIGLKNKKEVKNDKENEIFAVENEENIVENEVEENVVNDVEETNEIAEENIVNTVENKVTSANVSNKTPTINEILDSNSNNNTINSGVTDKKQKAIELVQKKWGEDDSVSFAFDFANENDEYIIAVKDKKSATVKNYFKVNLETEVVEIYY